MISNFWDRKSEHFLLLRPAGLTWFHFSLISLSCLAEGRRLGQTCTFRLASSRAEHDLHRLPLEEVSRAGSTVTAFCKLTSTSVLTDIVMTSAPALQAVATVPPFLLTLPQRYFQPAETSKCTACRNETGNRNVRTLVLTLRAAQPAALSSANVPDDT